MDYPERISANITFAEATRSSTANQLGMDNLPDEEQLENMRYIAERVFEPVRKHVAKDKAVWVTSFFRHPDVNAKIKGASKTSDHPKGSAMDLQKTNQAEYTNADIFNYIKNHLEFDQLIWEHGTMDEPKWVHVGLRKKGNRRQIIYNLK